jgi:hypothetical protein
MHAWAVRKVFGYPGDGINGVFGALNRARDKIAFLQARYEEMSAFMTLGLQTITVVRLAISGGHCRNTPFYGRLPDGSYQ